MRASERPATDLGVDRHSLRTHRLEVERAFRIPELPYVEVPCPAGELGHLVPAEQDVARRLHEPLALDHPLPVVREPALLDEGLEHRRLGLLELEKEGVVLVPAEQEHDPGTGADAPHAHDLARRVHVPEPLEQTTAVSGKRAAVRAEDVLDHLLQPPRLVRGQQLRDRHDQRGIAHDARLAVDDPGQPRERPETVLRPRLRDVALELLAELLARRLPPALEDRTDVEARVPDVEGSHGGEPAHRRPVLACCLEGCGEALAVAEPALARNHDDARHEPLDVPFPRAWKRLVEVVDVEDEVAVGRGEDAEVQEMRVAAELNRKPGARRGGEV
jgi:hypothetical protein